MRYNLFPCIDKYQKWQISALLKSCSDEFIPPLDYRSSPAQENFADRAGTGTYYQEILEHEFILATDHEEIVGLLAFLNRPPFLPQAEIYISVVCVDKKCRGQGIARNLYRNLFFHLSSQHYDYNIFIRTWSTNIIHRALLIHLGFTTEKVIPNHRGDGIDTIYYKYQCKFTNNLDS